MSSSRAFYCIYCGHAGPETDFDNEHVFSRSLCGTGNNWTLINRVCKTCNNQFSKFETELLQQAAESIARGFSGPLGRRSQSGSSARIQPLKVNHIYVQNTNDNLVYEGGFSFPAEFYFRPQMIDVGNGTIRTLVTERQEIKPFQDAVTNLIVQPKRITLPRPTGQKYYEIVTLEKIQGRWRPAAVSEINPKPSEIFFREFITRPNLPAMTSRLAQNDDGKLFFRASNLDAVGRFMELMFANQNAAPQPQSQSSPGNQTFLFGLQVDLNKVYKAVLKTGTNLVAHLYGDDILKNNAFDKLRKILLEDPATNDAGSICQISPGFPADFPRAGTDAHQMMLDVSNGHLRFRMRLYNSFGYSAVLAPFTAPIAARIEPTLPRRVLVEFTGNGIQEIPAWL